MNKKEIEKYNKTLIKAIDGEPKKKKPKTEDLFIQDKPKKKKGKKKNNF